MTPKRTADVGERGRKRTQYRWFPVTAESGLLGGIVASSRAEAMEWGAKEQYAEHHGFKLVRVKMEWKP